MRRHSWEIEALLNKERKGLRVFRKLYRTATTRTATRSVR
jgi:hypothetical protein